MSNMHPVVTVIIPRHNDPLSLLDRCVESLREQTLTEPWELIIVDDGSLDPVPPERYPDARVILQKHFGVAAARNTGLSAARGEYVGFADADDWLAPEYLAAALRTLRTMDADVVLGGIRVVQNDSTVQWRKFSHPTPTAVVVTGQALTRLAVSALHASPEPTKDSPIFTVTNVVGALYKTDLARKSHFPSRVLQAEDRVFNFEVLRLCRRVAFSPGVWYYYDRRNALSATRKVDTGDGSDLHRTVVEFARIYSSLCDENFSSEDKAAVAAAHNEYLLLSLRLAGSKPRKQAMKVLQDLELLTSAHPYPKNHRSGPGGITISLFYRQYATILIAFLRATYVLRCLISSRTTKPGRKAHHPS